MLRYATLKFKTIVQTMLVMKPLLLQRFTKATQRLKLIETKFISVRIFSKQYKSKNIVWIRNYVKVFFCGMKSRHG